MTMIFDEEKLLEQAANFDLDALAEIYDSYSSALYGYAMRLLGQTDLAEECVAESFSRFLQAISQGKGPRKHLKAYLYRIAHNWITDFYRRGKPDALFIDMAEGLSEESCLEDHVAENMRQVQVRQALFRLTADQRQVIMLVFIEGWQLGEVATALGKPVGAVKSLQHRAIKSLKKILKVEEDKTRDVKARQFARTASG